MYAIRSYYAWQSKSVDHILKAPGFTAKQRRMMLGETAAKLLGIDPKF